MDGITNGQKDRMMEGQGESSIAPLFQSGVIMNKVICRSTDDYPTPKLFFDFVSYATYHLRSL